MRVVLTVTLGVLGSCARSSEPPDAGRDAAMPASDAGVAPFGGGDGGDGGDGAPPYDPYECIASDRFDVIRDPRFAPIAGLDLARGDDGTLLFFVAGEPALGYVTLLGSDGAWSGTVTELGESGVGSVAHGRLDGAPGYTIAHRRADGVGGAFVDERAMLGGTTMIPASPAVGRPALAIGAETMIVAWGNGARSIEARFTDVVTGSGATTTIAGDMPAAAVDGAEVDLAFWFDPVVVLGRHDAMGARLSDQQLSSSFPRTAAGLDMVSAGDESALLAWWRGGVGGAGGSLFVRRGITSHGGSTDAPPADGALAYDPRIHTTLGAVFVPGRGVIAYATDWTGIGSQELEIEAGVATPVGAAPSVAVADTGLDGSSFLVLWNDTIDGRAGVSGKLLTCWE